MNIDVVWTLVSLVLTLFIFSYLFGDNPVFRFATAIFIGAAAGYFAVVIIYQVLLPRLVVPLIQGSTLAFVPLVLSGLLLTKLSPRMGRLGNIPMAVLVGAGAAIAIGGAALGTIFGQVKASIASIWHAARPICDARMADGARRHLPTRGHRLSPGVF